MVILTQKIFISGENLVFQDLFGHKILSFTALGVQNQALRVPKLRLDGKCVPLKNKIPLYFFSYLTERMRSAYSPNTLKE